MAEAFKRPRQFGISPPISEAAPDARDLALDTELRRTLNTLGVFESAPQRAAR